MAFRIRAAACRLAWETKLSPPRASTSEVKSLSESEQFLVAVWRRRRSGRSLSLIDEGKKHAFYSFRQNCDIKISAVIVWLKLYDKVVKKWVFALCNYYKSRCLKVGLAGESSRGLTLHLRASNPMQGYHFSV